MADPKALANVASFFRAATLEQQLAVETAQENFERTTSARLLTRTGMFRASPQPQFAAPALSVVPKTP
ncbi:MAG: hypothetical protein A3C44_03860 [Gammaproteobacteria bacterium RIFCSPHIGHO2_02_FULL_39_13]|nr:MAG: hypothetical protein A3C44_03860 [Gammaproteobacteria bacterium RIFCSPHIGHO2_02_FULL_39_13]OGT50275.1 MAG: hypothetical protein A3E53_00785 [Gammaproteobacteria bacterium RIFCSPHIGHO2_12_FULL_39_24]